MKFKTTIFLLFIFTPLLLGAQSTNYSVVKDTLCGSKIQIVVPQEWNKNILIIAHGYNPENYPLSADFSPENSFNANLALLKNAGLCTAVCAVSAVIPYEKDINGEPTRGATRIIFTNPGIA